MKGPAALWKGFRFGMLLQLAVGPVCLYIFRAASVGGFIAGEAGVAGVMFADGLYIALALLGVAAVIGRKGVRAALNAFGAVVLCLFGAATILGAFHISLLPGLSIDYDEARGTALGAAAVTASNPLTIVFWAGVFSSRIAQENMQKRQAVLFGLGALLSTLCFLTLVAAAGSAARQFLPDAAVTILNIVVGAFLIFFGIRMLVKKKSA